MSEPQTPNLQSKDAVMTATVQVIRAGTGKVENFNLVFKPIEDEAPKEKEAE
jgi:hypothetical protein